MKWPNLFLYTQDTGANITYSKVPQHTWKAGELIKEKYWNNLKDTLPACKKITITNQTDEAIQFDISYEFAVKILSNGGILFFIKQVTYGNTGYNDIYCINFHDFKFGYCSSVTGHGSWSADLNSQTLTFFPINNE